MLNSVGNHLEVKTLHISNGVWLHGQLVFVDLGIVRYAINVKQPKCHHSSENKNNRCREIGPRKSFRDITGYHPSAHGWFIIVLPTLNLAIWGKPVKHSKRPIGTSNCGWLDRNPHAFQRDLGAHEVEYKSHYSLKCIPIYK